MSKSWLQTQMDKLPPDSRKRVEERVQKTLKEIDSKDPDWLQTQMDNLPPEERAEVEAGIRKDLDEIERQHDEART